MTQAAGSAGDTAMTYEPGDLFDGDFRPRYALLVGVLIRLRCGDLYLCDVFNHPDDGARVTDRRYYTAAELDSFDLIGGPTCRRQMMEGT